MSFLFQFHAQNHIKKKQYNMALQIGNHSGDK